MAPRFVLPKRLPITPAFAGKRTPGFGFARFNSSSSTSSAARIVEMARAAEKPSTSIPFSASPAADFRVAASGWWRKNNFRV